MIAGVQFVTLPLVFLSSGFMSFALAPGWISDVGSFNPVQWALVAGRDALSADPDWGLVLSRIGLPARLHGCLRVARDPGVPVIPAGGLR